MKSNLGRAFTLVLLAAVVCGLTYYAVVVDGARLRGDIPPQLSPQELISIPPFTSAVEGVQITSARVVPDSAESLALEVEILNSTNRAITYIVLSSGSGGHGLGGGIVIQPYGTVTTKFVIANLEAGKPLSLSGVAWEDGTSSGYPLQAELARKGAERVARRNAEEAAR
jgi:hypothetical protein